MSWKRRLRQFGRFVGMVALALVGLVMGAYLMIFIQSIVFG